MMKHLRRSLHSAAALLMIALMLTAPLTARAAGESVSISGDTAYGSALTATLHGFDLESRLWSVEWYYGSGSNWELLYKFSNKTSMTINEAACIGQKIRLVATRTGDGYTVEATTGTVTKGRQEAPDYLRGRAPENGNDGYIENMSSELTYAWSADRGDNWTVLAKGTTKITGLAAGDYLVRLEENEWGFASEPATVTVPGSYRDAVEAWFLGSEFADTTLNGNASFDAVRKSLLLLQLVGGTSFGTYADTAITWSVDPADAAGSLIDLASGNVTLPTDGADQQFVLTAKMTPEGGSELTRTFDVTLKAKTTVSGEVTLIRQSSEGYVYREWAGVEAGDTLRVDVSGLEPQGDWEEYLSFQWKHKIAGTSTFRNISGAPGRAQELVVSDTYKGEELQVVVKMTSNSAWEWGQKTLSVPGTVVDAGGAPELNPLPPPPPPEEVKTRTVQARVELPAEPLAAGKLGWTLLKLDESGAIAEEEGQGVLEEGALELKLTAGTHRLEIKGDGFLPWVALFRDVDPEASALDVQLPVRLIPGKADELVDPYQIGLSDRAALLAVFGRKAQTSLPAAVTCDFNQNGRVEVFDLGMLIEHLGEKSKGAPVEGSYLTGDFDAG